MPIGAALDPKHVDSMTPRGSLSCEQEPLVPQTADMALAGPWSATSSLSSFSQEVTREAPCLHRGSATSGPMYGNASTQLFLFDETGKFVREIGKGVYGLGYSHGIRYDRQDNLWVVDKGTHSIMKFNPAGYVTLNLGRRPEGPDDPEELYYRGGRGGAGGGADRLTTIGKPDNRIYLGCAAVSGNGSWMEGAVAAGWKQVKALHERVMSAA